MSDRPLRERPLPQLGCGTSTLYATADRNAQRVSSVMGMTPTKASGALPWGSQKTDAQSEDARLEHKYTTRKSFAVSTAILQKLFKQGNLDRPRDLVLGLTFERLKDGPVPEDWVVVPLRTYQAYMDELGELRRIIDNGNK